MNLLKLKYLLLLIIGLTSCIPDKLKNTETGSQEVKPPQIAIEGHTYLKVTETDSGKFLIIPCDAFVESYRIEKDLIVHNWGQEKDLITTQSFNEESKQYTFKGFNKNSKKEEFIEFEKINESKSYLKVKNVLYIDSIAVDDIKKIDKPCDDPKESKSVRFSTIFHVKGVQFAKDCSSKEYVYFLVGGQFITSELEFNTRLEQLDETAFNIYYSSPVEDDQNGNNKLLEYASKEIPIAKANHINNNLEIDWFGFVNINNQEKFFEQNPFTGQIERDPIILDKCSN